jgi:hypothetical protein
MRKVVYKFTFTKKSSLIATVTLITVIFVILIILLTIKNSSNNLSQVVISSYPIDNQKSFIKPALGTGIWGRDPYQIIAQDDKDLANWFSEKKANLNAVGFFNPLYSFPEMRETVGYIDEKPLVRHVWLDANEAYKGLLIFEPYFPPIEDRPIDFVFKVLLNGREIKFAPKGASLTNTLVLQLKRGERYLTEIETEPIPEGVHSLTLLTFPFAYNNNPEQRVRYDLGGFELNHDLKIFSGTTKPQSQLEFYNWSTQSTKLKNLPNFFHVNDGSITEDSFPWWERGTNPVKSGEKINYTVFLNNPGIDAEEHCIIAFLDYKQIEIQDGKYRICGIVKVGHLGRLDLSFVAPEKEGNHYFQVMRQENPLMKETYAQVESRKNIATLFKYSSSGRFLIIVS